MSSASENGAAADQTAAETHAPQPDVRGSSAEGESVEAKPPRKRRRRRGKKNRDGSASSSGSSATGSSAAGHGEASQGPSKPSSPTLAALAGGLLSHIDDREIPCIHEGCDNTWTWTAREQIEAFGQPPPRRACAECRSLRDTTLACAVEGCARTWVWTRDAQLKHRAWARRHHHEQEGGRTGKQRGRKRRADAPRRKCEPCQQKLATLEDRVSVCKVHGCTREVILDKESQLKAWALLATEDLSAEAPLPKRMCEVCREFCRTHPDREVACGRSDCTRTWTYKTGAQLQAFLAGRLEDPIRLCSTCSQEQVAGSNTVDLANMEGMELMPCVVLGCDGTWLWHEGMDIAPARDGDEPVDRMCNAHRVERGVDERATLSPAPEVGAAEAEPDVAPEASPAEARDETAFEDLEGEVLTEASSA